MADVTLKQFDTRPFLVAVLKDTSSGVLIPIDLSSSGGNVEKVTLLMFAVSSTTKIIEQTSTGSLLSRTSESTAGQVQYKWSSSDTAIPGNYVAEFKIDFFDNTVSSVPNDQHIGVVIEDGVEPE